jgi:hypothetical protein
MKRIAYLTMTALMLASSLGFAQFKSQLQEQSDNSGSMLGSSAPSFLFGWFNPDKFHMTHSFSFSYMAGGGQGMSLGTYTNSMMYEFADNLRARADLSLSYSPYSSFKGLNNSSDKFSSLYLSRAQIDYQPWKDVLVRVQYQAVPYNSYYSPFYDPWYRENGF